MSRSFVTWIMPMVVALILCPSRSHAQTGPAKVAAAASSAPAPRHDITGIWTPVGGENVVVGGRGSVNMPSDGRPEHEPPYTPLALQTMKSYRPGNGVYEVAPPKINDPAVIYCDPQGMPRQDLYEFRYLHILQSPAQAVFLYNFYRLWRAVPMDGRPLPKNPPTSWFGTSVGKWEDDTTFVVLTTGVDDRTWLDKAGRPHSEEMIVEERFHRVSPDRLEMSVKVDDPKMYSKPWLAMDKLAMKSLPDDFQIPEMMCSVSEFMQYNKGMGFGNPTVINGSEKFDVLQPVKR